MKVLAIDPGYERLGVAILEKLMPKEFNQTSLTLPIRESLLFSETFKTSKDLPHPERLFLITKRISEIISGYRPDFLAIETLFFSKNHKTALLVAEARGAILAEAKKSGLQIVELNPNEIKLAVTGYGKSDKQSLYKIVPQLIKIDSAIKHDDEVDAIAVGLTFFAQHKTIAKKI